MEGALEKVTNPFFSGIMISKGAQLEHINLLRFLLPWQLLATMSQTENR